jgi:hypothetical protein
MASVRRLCWKLPHTQRTSSYWETILRFYQGQHRFYCGIDLHARSMHVCILEEAGKIVFDKNLPSRPESLLRAIELFRDGLVIGVECMFAWYWVSDFCALHDIAFVLGHALYMKAIHGGKAKNDRINAGNLARLLKGGNFPVAYAYSKGMREAGKRVSVNDPNPARDGPHVVQRVQNRALAGAVLAEQQRDRAQLQTHWLTDALEVLDRDRGDHAVASQSWICRQISDSPSFAAQSVM